MNEYILKEMVSKVSFSFFSTWVVGISFMEVFSIENLSIQCFANDC
jgi:hypothetical protein